VATMGTGELTLAPFPGLETAKGNPHSAAGGGSVAGGTNERLEGAVGVTGQSATFFGKPSHPPNAPRTNPSKMDPMIKAP
jgi:hypothetical protein